MPKGPNGEKRPADAIGLAVMIGRIATGEVADRKEPPENETPNPKKRTPFSVMIPLQGSRQEG